jgi:hypothetical protein
MAARSSRRTAPVGAVRRGSDFQRLGTLDPATGRFTPVANAGRWDVESFDISDDGRFIAYVTNEAGISRLKLLDPPPAARARSRLPAGVIGGLEIAPWGDIGFTFSSARPADAYSVDPQHARRHPLDRERDRRPRLLASTSSPS